MTGCFLNTACSVSHEFGMLYCYYHSSQKVFSNFFVISSLTHWLPWSVLFNFHILENILNLLLIRVLGSLGLTVAWLWSIRGGLRALFPSGEGSLSVLDDLSGRSFLKVGSQCLECCSCFNWTTVASTIVADLCLFPPSFLLGFVSETWGLVRCVYVCSWLCVFLMLTLPITGCPCLSLVTFVLKPPPSDPSRGTHTSHGCCLLSVCPWLCVCSVCPVGYALVSGLPEATLCPPSEGVNSRKMPLCPFAADVGFGHVVKVTTHFLVALGSLWALPLPHPGQAVFPGSPGSSCGECMYMYVYACLRICTCVCAHVCIYMYAHACVSVCVDLCVYARVCQNMSSC